MKFEDLIVEDEEAFVPMVFKDAATSPTPLVGAIKAKTIKVVGTIKGDLSFDLFDEDDD